MVFVLEETWVPVGSEYMNNQGIEPNSQQWEASMLPRRQSDSHVYVYDTAANSM